MKQYYVMLRSLLRNRPDLRRYLKRCRHCGIFFLTHPRNAGRRDLRCAFGCREAHRRRQSTERSVAYYGTEEGKAKKRIQNGKRMQRETGADRKPAAAEVSVDFHAGIVRYIAILVGIIERRRVSEEEVRQMLARAMRQHRIARRGRIDYVIAHLKNNGP